MNDLKIARERLKDHTICLYRAGVEYTSDLRGIAPMMGYLETVDLSGFSVADKVVGKAAAMLFLKAGIKAVYAVTLSESAKELLERHGVPVEYQALTDRIINRAGTDTCPMEKTVLSCDDIKEGYRLLKNKYEEMRKFS